MSLLYIKSAGVLKTAGGTVKVYSISGVHFNHKDDGGGLMTFAVTGSGYALGTAFRFTYTAMNSFGVTPFYGFHAEGYIENIANLASGGVSWGYADYADLVAKEYGADDYTLVDPLTITIPYAIQGLGGGKLK
jgi:hypothetical protein